MSFTQKKFECLAPLNQKKKFAYAIREYLDGRQPLCYVSDMLEWYCHSAECGDYRLERFRELSAVRDRANGAGREAY